MIDISRAEFADIYSKTLYDPEYWKRMEGMHLSLRYTDHAAITARTGVPIPVCKEDNPPLDYLIVPLEILPEDPTDPYSEQAPPWTYMMRDQSASLFILPPRSDDKQQGLCSATRVQQIIDPRLTTVFAILDGRAKFLVHKPPEKGRLHRLHRNQKPGEVSNSEMFPGRLVTASCGHSLCLIAAPEGAVVLSFETPRFQPAMEVEFLPKGIAHPERTILAYGQRPELPQNFWEWYFDYRKRTGVALSRRQRMVV